jgi:hypothetical protein
MSITHMFYRYFTVVRFDARLSLDAPTPTASLFIAIAVLFWPTGKYDDAFWELQMAADLSDNLVYDEPWGWMQPPVHALGALNLEQVKDLVAHFIQ